ncbi:hypothetical protein FIU87_02445 [Bacillus sp. THAF10]|nr:hypothetical protein FIU87_02445 [Bacillus sp. THAF10]
MERKLKKLRKAMDSTTHKGVHFTEFHKNKIRNAVHTSITQQPKRPNKLVIISLSTFAIFLFAFFITTEFLGQQKNEPQNVSGDDVTQTGELFSVMPDPLLHAGKPYGYIFSFHEPFDTYEGKELSVTAVHEETEHRVQAVESELITEPSSGYTSLERFTTTFELPYGGEWKLEVYLNGQGYGETVVQVADDPNPFQKQLTKMEVELVRESGVPEDKLTVTDEQILSEINSIMDKVSWDTTIEVSWAKHEDVRATLFYKLKEDQAVKSYEYRIWINGNQSIEILSFNPNENIGKLEPEDGKRLKQLLVNE